MMPAMPPIASDAAISAGGRRGRLWGLRGAAGRPLGDGVGGHGCAIVGPAAGDSPRRLHAMANIASQKKRILRAERERLENRRYTSTIKTFFRRLDAAVEAKDDTTADAEHRELVSLIDKAVKTGALHRNNGARKKSRAARIRAGAGS